jgi:hypothetical protein
MLEKKRSQRKISTKKAPPEYCEAVDRILSEDEEQILVINHCHSHEDPRLAMIFAIPNAGRRSLNTGRKMKATGLKAGVPDLFLPIQVWKICGRKPSFVPDFISSLLLFLSKFTGLPMPFVEAYGGLFIEMKRIKNSEHRLSQQIWQCNLKKQGYQVVVAKGHQAAIDAIEGYLFGVEAELEGC